MKRGHFRADFTKIKGWGRGMKLDTDLATATLAENLCDQQFSKEIADHVT